jgi:hypothetical protein
LGCSASSTATAAGVAMSRGKAYASLSDLEIRGTVTYDDVAHLSKIDGNFGADVALARSHVSGPSKLDGERSRVSNWSADFRSPARSNLLRSDKSANRSELGGNCSHYDRRYSR